jgi:hypothetical protein
VTKSSPAFLLAILAVGAETTQAQAPAQRWLRGNTHTHTWNSDGDSPPHEVVRWYRERGYQFVVITDHEYITDVGPLNALMGAPHRFVIVAGQELTQRVADPAHREGLRQAHLNGLGVTQVVLPIGERGIASGTTIADTYRRNVAALRAAGGVVQANHPNFRWSVRLEEMLALPDSTLFELWNGHPTVYNSGGVDTSGHAFPSTEVLWDSLLTRGKLLFGVADDDSHHFRPQDAENPDLARPGRGWVYVRADTLSTEAILSGLRRGDFYSSTGVVLRRYEASATEIVVEVVPAADRSYRIEFIGDGGRILASTVARSATYRIVGSEGYVRARVVDSSDRRAWMQPVMVPAGGSP